MFMCVQLINWKLDHIGMNPSAEAYLVLHRFGSVSTHPQLDSYRQLDSSVVEVVVMCHL